MNSTSMYSRYKHLICFYWFPVWDSILSFKVVKDTDNTPQATEENFVLFFFLIQENFDFDFDVLGMQSLLCYLLNEIYIYIYIYVLNEIILKN